VGLGGVGGSPPQSMPARLPAGVPTAQLLKVFPLRRYRGGSRAASPGRLVLVLFCGARFFRAPFHLFFQITISRHGGIKVTFPGLLYGKIVADFQSCECAVCEDEKESGHSFCVVCYRTLPAEMRKALWRRFGQGYEDAYSQAFGWLRAKARKPVEN
jgi:hypothetical protein